MDKEEQEKYLKAYYDNEADANKQMSIANLFSAGVMLIIWILYLTGVFPIASRTFLLVNISFPVAISILVSPFLYLIFNPKTLKKPGYKYFVIFSFTLVIAGLNIILPKHTMIGWALCIVLTNHYYNPKVGLFTFITVMILMLLCIYGGMFLGEYDPNLLGKGIIDGDEIYWPQGAVERFKMLHEMLVNGENRYLKVFVFYYTARGAFLTLIFLVSNSLNKRTYKLLVDEINVNSVNEKTKTELEVAKEIQLNTLPKEFLTNKDIEIQAELKAAKEVGGDFYDYFNLDDDHIAILIGDVSGKGIPAAMFMMKTITAFKDNVSLYKTPSQTLKDVNKTIHIGNESNMFVTCFLAIINTKTGEMIYSNAGHNPPLIGQNGHFEYLKCQSGFLLGTFDDAFVKDEAYQLNNGDIITLYTDGITEAMNKQRQLFGEKRLLEIYNKKEYSCLVELHYTLKDEINKFTNGALQSDDITYLTLKYHGDNYLYKENIFDATKEKTSEMLDFVKSFMEDKKIEKAFLNNALVVLDEMLSNTIKYAYNGDFETKSIYLRLLYNLDKKEFVTTIIDTGIPFNPFLFNKDPLSGDANNIKEGGLGILIVKKLMSEYAYDRINNKNIITLKKRF